MSLATRCTSCGTVFRVVQDQLKVSEGWVRCGRCDAVFNALEGLFDLGRDTPPEWTGEAPVLAEDRPGKDPLAEVDLDVEFDAVWPPAPATPVTTAAPSEEKGHSSSFPSTAPAAFQDLLADPIDAHLFRKRGPVSDAKVDERDRLEFSDARFDSDLFAENSGGDDTVAETSTSATSSSSPTPASTPTCSPRARRSTSSIRPRCRRTTPASCRSKAPTGSPTFCAAPSARRDGGAPPPGLRSLPAA